MTNGRAIRTIAVAGGGIVGLSAALAFERALPGTRVTVIATTPDPAALADVLPTLHPMSARFHALIGVDEAELVRSGIATHHLGTRFERWSASGQPWIHAFGPYGKPAGAIPFDQIWVRAHRAGNALDYDRYSVGAELARNGKFVHPAKDPDFTGSRFAYGLRVDPDRHRAHLRSLASEVEVVAADIGEIERREDGGIAALTLTDGERLEADLFIDCTGPAARLISPLENSFEDWSAWMPFDRFALESVPREGIPQTSDLAVARENGWTIQWPVRERTLVGRVGREGTSVARGRRLKPWVHNVLAIGDSATALDPLHGYQLALAQNAILLALELLPGRDFASVETDEYNRRAEQVTRRVRDFLALHYLRSGIWPELASTEAPDSLAETLDQYEHRGRLPYHEEEIVSRDSWTAALLGLGVSPRHDDPQSLAVPLEQTVPAMQRLTNEIRDIVAGLPSYGDYLAQLAR